MLNNLFFVLGVGAPILAAIFAVVLIGVIGRKDAGTEQMQRIAALIRKGAMAFLRVEYSVLAVFVVVMFCVLALFLPRNGVPTAISFVIGASLSALAGWIGMRTATTAAVRTTQAARTGLAPALAVAFQSGAVMGLTVVALGTLGVTGLYYFFGGLEAGRGPVATEDLFGFSLGASSIALFARVGGGIFTKAADVAGDLSGKVEAGIPEDDPRNPATIADSVGDNVGDVAGMGADLFESYVGSMIASIALAWAMTAADAFRLFGADEPAFASLQGSLVLFPILLSGLGILASIVGTFAVRTNNEKKIQDALFRGMLVASALVLAGGWLLTSQLGIPMNVYYCVLSGLI
ncbi:MAG TPA: sodium/proton-translocating pyrophosphatase, partial [Vicinamibacterales bacterium]|nr:sodium/proton-translocating pyrophosphatase [Vicinamibacterales bacterium]